MKAEIKVNDRKLHTRAIYIDLELTCWAVPPPSGMQQEIIEVGFVEMDLSTLRITREKSCFVKPKRWEISPRCTKLTGITAADIRTARSFPDVLSSLTKEFSPSTALCCTWGDDAEVIAATCEQHGLRTPLRNLLDLANLVKGLLLLRDSPSLGSAVEALGLKFDGAPHTAMADARNTALIHRAVLQRMRRLSGPLASQADETNEPLDLSSFGQKLRAALEQR